MAPHLALMMVLLRVGSWVDMKAQMLGESKVAYLVEMMEVMSVHL